MDRCLKFRLPSGAGGLAPSMARGNIAKQLRQLTELGRIGPYKTKTHGYDYKVWLEKDTDYSVFLLIWTPSYSKYMPELVYEDYESGG